MDDGFKDPEQTELDDLSSTTEETPNSSSAASLLEESKLMFEGSKPLVLELHDMTRSNQPNPGTNRPKKKLKRKKKSKEAKAKKGSSSTSDASLNPKNETTKEEFYDAHESYYDIPPHQQQIVKSALSTVTTAPVVGGVVIQEISEHGPALKMEPEPMPTAADALASATTAITKPTQ